MDHTDTGREEPAIWQSSRQASSRGNACTDGDNSGDANCGALRAERRLGAVGQAGLLAGMLAQIVRFWLPTVVLTNRAHGTATGPRLPGRDETVSDVPRTATARVRELHEAVVARPISSVPAGRRTETPRN